jgi:hypothetical protein
VLLSPHHPSLFPPPHNHPAPAEILNHAQDIALIFYCAYIFLQTIYSIFENYTSSDQYRPLCLSSSRTATKLKSTVTSRILSSPTPKLTHIFYLFSEDHVYCSPAWSVRDGTPYSVARIMEFLHPSTTTTSPSKPSNHYDRVRLAWYYRPSDVSDRPVADSRLLLAAIYSEVCDINQLRAKCHVVHRDKISDLAGWKRRPDRFYFNRLFDPYIKKEFDVIQSSDVRNC